MTSNLIYLLLVNRAHLCCRMFVATIFFLHASEYVSQLSADENFEKHIRPLLLTKCLNCHGESRSESSLKLNSLDDAILGGDSGAAIDLMNPAGSLILKAIRHEDGLQMPPDEKLPDETISAIEQWIASGAPWPERVVSTASGPSLRSGPIQASELEHWAYKPLNEQLPSQIDNARWNEHVIDRYLYLALSSRGLEPRPPADKLTLLRRATFDLTGLPPTPSEISDFLADDSEDAYADLIDRLLASDAYGEKWGRYWLDLVRYADTAGEGADFPIPQAYKYRNWVIDAFNTDMPYDQFLIEQLAGDYLAKEPGVSHERYKSLMTATGFIAISRRFGFDSENHHHLTIQDTIDTVAQTVLGLTMGCARCHDHKYDPINVEDYYGWYGIFNSTRYTFPGSEQKPRPYDLCADVPSHVEAELRAVHESSLSGLSEEEKLKRNEALPFGLIYGAVDKNELSDVAIHLRGEPAKSGAVVPRRNLQILGGEPIQSRSSGRIDLARWLTSSSNPLMARVMVNRIWQGHFGRGIVASSNDFGARGDRPSHPELLDWLAIRFQESGYSIKAMHRLIMNSEAYRQSSDTSTSARQTNAMLTQALVVDPDNRLLVHFPRRRLSAEEIRDAMLSISGTLDNVRGQEHPFPLTNTWAYSQHNPFHDDYKTVKRSVYLMQKRLRKHSYLALFDGADPNSTTPYRVVTTVPTQSLYLMNNEFVTQCSDALAMRINAHASQTNAQVEWATILALGRQATDIEIDTAVNFIDQINTATGSSGEDASQNPGLTAFARSLLIRNEFLFVE